MSTELDTRPAWSSLADFLYPAPAPRRVGAILRWWESRRLPYNLFVGGAGLVTLTTGGLLGLVHPDQFGLTWEVVGPVIAFGVAANLCYLLGPAVEIAAHVIWKRDVLPIGPALYRMGLTFSVGLALLPTLVFLIVSFILLFVG